MAPVSAWVSLPWEWKLQDVQAALNVVVTFLSTLGISAFARYCWQSGARNIASDQSIPLSSLLSINTLGDAFDVLYLLRSKIFHRRYPKIFTQCIIVLCLSITSLFSGPIARYSTQRGEAISPKTITGLLTTRFHYSILNAPVLWNETFTSLDRAGFPYDQLLDYLPDTWIPWVYKAEEWNSSWVMSCKHTDSTPITLYDTGNCTTTYDEVPGLEAVISLNEYGSEIDVWWGGYYEKDIYKDVLLGLGGVKYTDYDNATNITYGITMSLAAVHLHELPRQENSSSYCNWGKGNITAASYTKIECDLKRLLHDPEFIHMAFPDVANFLARGFVEYYQARFTQESISNSRITVLTPVDLVRFYQTWLITKDTQYRESVPRTISVQIQHVQISIVFLIIAALVTILALLGILIYAFSMVRHWNTLETTPQSKLEWMLQSIQAQNHESSPHISPEQAFLRHSVTSSSTDVPPHVISKKDRRRFQFENAKCGAHFQEQGPGGWLLSQRHGHASYNYVYASGQQARAPASHTIPRKPVALVGEDQAPIWTVALTDYDDMSSRT
jgi:hypothetical protein